MGPRNLELFFFFLSNWQNHFNWFQSEKMDTSWFSHALCLLHRGPGHSTPPPPHVSSSALPTLAGLPFHPWAPPPAPPARSPRKVHPWVPPPWLTSGSPEGSSGRGPHCSSRSVSRPRAQPPYLTLSLFSLPLASAASPTSPDKKAKRHQVRDDLYAFRVTRVEWPTFWTRPDARLPIRLGTLSHPHLSSEPSAK